MSEYILREIGDPETLTQEIVGELIRCKDCKYRLHLGPTEHWPEQYFCLLDDRIFYPARPANNPEWFCADGERRTDENDN